MVIFDFKEEATGTEHVAIATSKCVPSGIFHRVQHPSQVKSTSLLLRFNVKPTFEPITGLKMTFLSLCAA